MVAAAGRPSNGNLTQANPDAWTGIQSEGFFLDMEWFRLSPDFSERAPKPLMVTSEARFSCASVELCFGVVRHDWDSNASVRSKDADHDGPPDDYLGNSLMIPILSCSVENLKRRA